MPAIDARDSSEAAGPNVGLIVGLILSALVLILAFVALFIPILKRRRAARNTPPASTLEEFMSKAERERVHEKFYPGHRNSDSMGPLLEDAPNWAPTGRQIRIPRSDLPPLPDNAGHSYDDDHDQDLGPQMKTGPITYTHAPPGLRVLVPQSAPVPASNWLEQPRTAPPPSPDSPASSDSESMYSERSASTRMHNIDFASPPPPVPALPEYLRPRTELPPETLPLARGDTVVVAGLLKSRAKRLPNAPERSMTRTSRIERADSIRSLSPSPTDERPEQPRRTRGTQRAPPPPLPTAVRNDGSFDDTLDDYYTAQPIDRDDDAMSVSSYETVRPTKSAF
ncbi:hypothetical protein DFH09DRAFT_1269127 [Mycena vulgaris]|nr:hypothetical protein DFH09DRAFT_1269127 [Mycena vulgaris]